MVAGLGSARFVESVMLQSENSWLRKITPSVGGKNDSRLVLPRLRPIGEPTGWLFCPFRYNLAPTFLFQTSQPSFWLAAPIAKKVFWKPSV